MTHSRRSSPGPLRDHATWVRAGYLLVLGFALLSPLAFRWDPAFLAERLERLLSPGALGPGDLVDAARNVVLFAGWGLLLAVTDGGRSRRHRLLVALATGAGIGLGAELVQLALPVRTPSLLDAAMNAAGAGVGAGTADVSMRWVRRQRSRPTALGVPTAVLAAPYFLAVSVEAAFPLLRNAGEGLRSGGPLVRAEWAVEHFRWGSILVVPWLDVLLFLPAGFLLAAALWEVDRTRERAFEWTAGLGLVAAVLGEAAHAPLGAPVELGPLVVHAAAIAAGGALAVRAFPRWLRRRRGPARTRDFLLAYVVVLALWRLRPFVPELDPAAIAREFSLPRWSPLSALGARRDLYSVSDVFRSFLLFVPVGAALAARERTTPRTKGRTGASARRTVGGILALAVVVEAGQAFVGQRFFDGTDLLVTVAGAAVAWSVTRRK